MNTLGYLQFFDGLAEQRRGTFLLEKISSKLKIQGHTGNPITYRCVFKDNSQTRQSEGASRKEALALLYRALR